MKTATQSTFATLLMHDDGDPAARAELRRQVAVALRPAVQPCVAAFGVWTATRPVSGAVVAPAQVKVELNRKTVQHQEGGIVREILVRDGQQVRAGEPLLVVGDVRSDAELSLLQDQLRAERIRSARAAAEAALERASSRRRIGDQPEAAEHLARERALFAARRRTLDEQIAALRSQIREAQAQVEALGRRSRRPNPRRGSRPRSWRSTTSWRRRASSSARACSRCSATAADYRGPRRRVPQRPRARTPARRRARGAHRAGAQPVPAAGRRRAERPRRAMRELEERLRPSRDQVERQFVRSPVDGEVMALRVSARRRSDRAARADPRRGARAARSWWSRRASGPRTSTTCATTTAAEVRLSCRSTVAQRAAAAGQGRVRLARPDQRRPTAGEAWFVATVEVDAAALARPSRAPAAGGHAGRALRHDAAAHAVEYLVEPLAFPPRAART